LEEAALMAELETSFMIHLGSPASCDVGAELNLRIGNAAIYCAPVVLDSVMVWLR
jgi:hypothetical protein